MKSKNETFASLVQSLGYRYDLRPIFDDILTMLLCSFSRNVSTGKSYDEDLYMATIAKYAEEEVRNVFPKLLALLILEMEERIDSDSGNDVLGEVYELNFCRKGSGQFFTPWHICKLMGALSGGSLETEEPLRILDPSCGSGRMLIAGARSHGKQHRYYGIDIDHTCVKMTALNLFLNGIFHGEVMWANALSPNDFRMSYVLSFLPFGIFRISDKEHSRLWHMHQNAFKGKEPVPKQPVTFLWEDSKQTGPVSQLHLF